MKQKFYLIISLMAGFSCLNGMEQDKQPNQLNVNDNNNNLIASNEAQNNLLCHLPLEILDYMALNFLRFPQETDDHAYQRLVKKSDIVNLDTTIKTPSSTIFSNDSKSANVEINVTLKAKPTYAFSENNNYFLTTKSYLDPSDGLYKTIVTLYDIKQKTNPEQIYQKTIRSPDGVLQRHCAVSNNGKFIALFHRQRNEIMIVNLEKKSTEPTIIELNDDTIKAIDFNRQCTKFVILTENTFQRHDIVGHKNTKHFNETFDTYCQMKAICKGYPTLQEGESKQTTLVIPKKKSFFDVIISFFKK